MKLQHGNGQTGSDAGSTLMLLEADRVFICGVRLDRTRSPASAHQCATGNEVSCDVIILGGHNCGHNVCMLSHKASFYFVLSLLNYGISRDYR